MSFQWITEKERREHERGQAQAAKAIADFVRTVIAPRAAKEGK
jgi:hypothetical protein